MPIRNGGSLGNLCCFRNSSRFHGSRFIVMFANSIAGQVSIFTGGVNPVFHGYLALDTGV
jgi:hypothetical protein